VHESFICAASVVSRWCSRGITYDDRAGRRSLGREPALAGPYQTYTTYESNETRNWAGRAILASWPAAASSLLSWTMMICVCLVLSMRRRRSWRLHLRRLWSTVERYLVIRIVSPLTMYFRRRPPSLEFVYRSKRSQWSPCSTAQDQAHSLKLNQPPGSKIDEAAERTYQHNQIWP
jgi:hypothetical protein